VGEIGGGVAAKAGALDAGLTSEVEVLAQLAPSGSVGAGEVAASRRSGSRREGGDDPHGAAQDGGGRGALTSRRASLVVARAAKELLEVVVRRGQARDGVAVEQAGTVAPRDLAEMVDRRSERPGTRRVAAHGGEEAVKLTPHGRGILTRGVGEEVGRRVYPGVGPGDVRPERGGGVEATPDQRAEPRERGRWSGDPPLCTRPILSEMAARRDLSLGPEAASGARPSSVMALRTAAQ
jgi:hypothetical protein